MTVLISGAGPTGLTVACALLQRGIPVRVVDSAPTPAATSRALALQPRGQEVLDRLNALGDLPERGIGAMNITVYDGGRELLVVRLGRTPVTGGHPILMVSQADVEGELRRRLAELGGAVEWGATLTAAAADVDGVTVTLDGAGTARADWVIGCDGAHSAVRKLAGINFPGVPIIEHFVLADVHAQLPLSRAGNHAWPHRDGFVVVFPLPGEDLWRVIASVSTEEAGVLGQLDRLILERTGLRAELSAPEWLSTFRIQRRLADRYRSGRLLLAGDAAHIHSPFGGQGMNTGIGDAENLAWKLALVVKGVAGEELLDTYQAERRPVAADVVSNTTQATQILLGANVATRTLRDRVVLPIARHPRAQQMMLRGASQLGVSYRGGPLAPAGRLDKLASTAAMLTRIPDATAARPGERVPDLKCVLPEGTMSRLYRELAGRWAVVNPGPETTAAVRRLGDEVVTLTADIPDTVLIRPDAHLAWRSGHATTSIAAALGLFSAPR